MKFDPNRPIWLQVMTELKTDMATGKRLPGTRLPGGRDLAVQYGINPNTAARVYQELEKEGLCETRRGMGTYVTENAEHISTVRQEMALQAVRDFLDSMAVLGISPEEAAEMIRKQEE
ncbi:MAG: GntR family transcriptional regulator [Clostridia bacterium]|jgi:GntR family transcriptional regulator|nr:GntR family transcriptional regulator [Clostridia bacterium]